MNTFRFLISIFATLCCNALAQISVDLKPSRNTFLEGENPQVRLTITNRTGGPISLQSDGLSSWLHFKVTNEKGEIFSPISREFFRRVEIPAGRSMSREISLGKYYRFRENGRYTARANINLIGGASFASNGAHFTIVTAPTIWSKRIGVPIGQPSEGHTRRFSLKRAIVDRTTRLFVQLDDEDTGQTLRIMQLGQGLSASETSCLFDDNHTLHVLFQNTGVLYVHSQIDIHGDYGGHEIFRRSSSKPKLVRGPEGEVVVIGGLLFDPEADRQERSRIRKVSERPSVIFQ